MLRAPFPYFGAKSSVADIVWDRLGNPSHYIEPFFGSGAVLLMRPNYTQDMIETINDADGFICNVWRAIQAAPDDVAKVCDWPVNHADLIARKAILIREEDYLLANLCKDDKWHDVELAGYWIWAASCWIGSGMTRPGAIPHVAGSGKGVHAVGKRPHVSNSGKGVHAMGQMPHVSTSGMGVHAKEKMGGFYDLFDRLSFRLRRVRVVCGDWSRVCGGDWQDGIGGSTCGVFFDPPYSDVAGRNDEIYHVDCLKVAHDVREWCIERGAKPSYRICLAGYYDEHEELETKHGWSVQRWKAQGGYAHLGKEDSPGKLNRHKEALFFSPHCVTTELF